MTENHDGHRISLRQLFVLAGGVLLILTSGGYRSHCGRCADQKSEIKVLWITVATPEPHYDEYGIVERWEAAHGKPCPNIWLAGPFDDRRPDPRYWPRLHFRVAAARRTNDVAALVRAAPAAELRRTDALGRTVLHWLATHRTTPERDALVTFLIEQGLNPDQKDSDGLSARAWAANAGTAPLGRP